MGSDNDHPRRLCGQGNLRFLLLEEIGRKSPTSNTGMGRGAGGGDRGVGFQIRPSAAAAYLLVLNSRSTRAAALLCNTIAYRIYLFTCLCIPGPPGQQLYYVTLLLIEFTYLLVFVFQVHQGSSFIMLHYCLSL